MGFKLRFLIPALHNERLGELTSQSVVDLSPPLAGRCTIRCKCLGNWIARRRRAITEYPHQVVFGSYWVYSPATQNESARWKGK